MGIFIRCGTCCLSAGLSPTRRLHGGLDRMYEDPADRARQAYEQHKYAQALNDQVRYPTWLVS